MYCVKDNTNKQISTHKNNKTKQNRGLIHHGRHELEQPVQAVNIKVVQTWLVGGCMTIIPAHHSLI